MAKIIYMDVNKTERAKVVDRSAEKSCPHKTVIAYAVYRTVHCAACGIELDPFDVLLDLIKGHVPDGGRPEEDRFDEEERKRKK